VLALQPHKPLSKQVAMFLWMAERACPQESLVLMSQLLGWGHPILPVKHHLPADGIDCRYLPAVGLLDWSPYFPQYKANK